MASVGTVCLAKWVEEVQNLGTVAWSFTYPLALKGGSVAKSEALREGSG